MISKKYYEKKLREEEEATAHVFQDFLTSFQDVPNTPMKVFIKSGTLNPSSDQKTKTENISDTQNQIYIPKRIMTNKDATLKSAIECAKLLKETKVYRNKSCQKPLSNLELLKEEIKQRHLLKEESQTATSSILQTETSDPASTNLFIANLNQRVTEEQLMLLFGKFGCLASVKIMWPRGEPKFRNYANTNCGFVAFMSRKDAERALNALENRDDMRISWGKCVEIPTQPIYIPPELTQIYLPPPYSGLPYNAQPLNPNYEKPKNSREMIELLSFSIVKVTLPQDKRMLCIIHRMIEFVIREGSLFEALILTNEGNNPDFAFLFDYKSPLHVYYRWKLFSILNGDAQRLWSTKPFRMIKNGPIWIPPTPIDYTAGMPDELINVKNKIAKNVSLSNAQCERFMNFIRNLDMNRNKISVAMSFCFKHISAIQDSLNILLDSLQIISTNPLKKIARLYLLSDIFWNCKRNKIDPSKYENSEDLSKVFLNLKATYINLNNRIDKENFKKKILAVLHSWNVNRIFSRKAVENLENLISNAESNEDEDEFTHDEPLDGANLLKRSINTDNDVNIVTNRSNFFINSSWNRVDPRDLESQAMSTEKLYELELCGQKKPKKIKRKGSELTVSSKWDDSD